MLDLTLPVVYEAAAADIRSAVENIRSRVKDLAEPRLYQTAVALAVLLRTNGATGWQSWDTPPPSTAIRFGRAELVHAMWQLFGTTTAAMLHSGSAVAQQLNNPQRVMLDVLFGANGPLTLVGNVRVAIDSRRDSAKLTIDNPGWIWSADAANSTSAVKVVEYNPVNTLNQQNGIGCALSASTAVASEPSDPASVYAVGRGACPKRRLIAGAEPKCMINAAVCGGQGDGAERATTKPRLLAPPVPGHPSYLVLPDTMKSLVVRATRGGQRLLPAANDLSLLASWCHTNGSGAQDAGRLPSLFGADGIRLLTSTK